MPLEARAGGRTESSPSQASRTIGDQATHFELALAVPSPESGPGHSSAGLPGQIPALDGLRGIAILLVLLWHGVFSLPTNSRLLSNLFAVGSLSWSGVDLFFVLSGFLIGGILLDAKQSTRYFKTFYVRRAFRILPLYGFVTGLFLAFHLPFVCTMLHGDCLPSQIPLASYPTFTQNLWMAYLGKWGLSGMVVTWSLAVEEQFHLTIPIVIRKLSRSHLAVALISIVIGAPLLRTFMLFNFEHGRFADYLLMPCRADALCLECWQPCWCEIHEPGVWLLRNEPGCTVSRLDCWSSSVGLVMKNTTKPRPRWPRSDIPCWPCSLPAACSSPSSSLAFHSACSAMGVLMELGGIAYCTYLVHMPLMEAGAPLCQTIFPIWESFTSLTRRVWRHFSEGCRSGADCGDC